MVKTAQSGAASAWKNAVVRRLAAAARHVTRRLPEDQRELLDQGLLRRHVAWRDLDLDFSTTDGFRVSGSIRETIIRRLYFDDVWEPGVVRLLRRKLRPGDVFVDAGSNFGYMSLVASRCVGKEGRVYAIDPSPTIFARLRRVMAENGADNVVCINAAVSDAEKTLRVYLANAINTGNTTVVEDEWELARRGARFEAEIEAKPLGRLIPEADLGRIALIKVDVEGHEREVLAGMRPALDQLRQDVVLMVEMNKYMLNKVGETAETVLAPLRERGFQAFDVPDPQGVCVPMPDVDAHYNPWGVVDVVLSRHPL